MFLPSPRRNPSLPSFIFVSPPSVYPSLHAYLVEAPRLCDNKVREALGQRLAMLIRRMLRQRRRTTRLQESRLADIALDVHSLLVLPYCRSCQHHHSAKNRLDPTLSLDQGHGASHLRVVVAHWTLPGTRTGMGSHGVEAACGHHVAGLTTFF